MDRKRQKLSPRKTKKKMNAQSTPKTKSHPSNPLLICNKEVVIQLERLSDSVVTEMTTCGSTLPPEQTKKRMKLSTPKAKSRPSYPQFICDKEVVVQLERVSDSVVAEMTAKWSALPPEQAKKMSIPKTNSPLSNLQLVDKEVAISLEKLIDSVVMEVTAHRSALQPQQVNESNDDALGINSLPAEIIEKIFGYLTQNQLGQIARVCRRWNVLTKSPVLWKKVNVKLFPSLRNEYTVAESFINRLPSCAASISLIFTGNTSLDFEELCVKLQKKCPHLEELMLTNSAISDSLSSVIGLCTQWLQDVKNLIFHYSRFGCHNSTDERSGISKIEILELIDCYIDSSNKPPFSKMPHLKQLHLFYTMVHGSLFKNDTSFFNQLHMLNLGHASITARIFPAIQNHGHNLKELYLCFMHHDLTFTDSEFPHLKTICLSCTGVTCEGVVSLIQSCPSLENVYVDERVAESFAAYPFVVAYRSKSGIVKAIGPIHGHNVNYLHN